MTRARRPDSVEMISQVGGHSFEMIHDWGELPSQIQYGRTHGICGDRQGNIYVFHTVGTGSSCSDSIVVFDASGRFVRSWGDQFSDGAHGMVLHPEDNEEFLYLCDSELGLVLKMTLEGDEVWRLGYPEESPQYGPGGMRLPYSPTDLAIAPGGDIFVCDGYGSSYINQYDRHGRFIRSFGGLGADPGRLDCPHGILVDCRSSETVLMVADRRNHRIQHFTMDGRHVGFTYGTNMPCHLSHYEDDQIVVADLTARVTLLDHRNRVMGHLGDDSASDWRRTRTLARPHFTPGRFVAPHATYVGRGGDIFVVEWVEVGRVTKLRRLPGGADPGEPFPQ